MKKKRDAIEFWNSSTLSTPEKQKHVELRFHLTPNTQTRVFRNKDTISKAKRSLPFRAEGAGRETDEFWLPIEERLLIKFQERRAMGCVVKIRHLLEFVYQICAEIGFNIALEAQKRQWVDTREVLRKRVGRFMEKYKIIDKRASRQIHKNAKVSK